VVIVDAWRRRPEIASLAGVRAPGNEAALIRGSVERCRELGLDAFLIIEWDEIRRPEFYDSLGLSLLDEVLPFDIDSRKLATGSQTPGEVVRIHSMSSQWADSLLELDHEAFPWLWINSRSEFEHYLGSLSVEVWGQVVEGRLATYVGFTAYGDWGHIDRIAVHPDFQRRGLARELMHHAGRRMQRLGVRTIGLTTQAGNWKSQRLYHQLGFRRTPRNRYAVYGVLFRPDVSHEQDRPSR
jgi:ribosomal protein S18 acetylase RimI-like enzyme